MWESAAKNEAKNALIVKMIRPLSDSDDNDSAADL